VIVFQNVRKTFPVKGGRRVILDGFSGVFPPKTSVGILGHNGAGKSTFIRLMAGNEAPDSGEIHRLARVSWPVGLSSSFNKALSGAENIRFVCRIYGQEYGPVFESVTDFAELGRYMYMPVKVYSSGMKSRLAFGLSMALDFDYYLIDEVTSVGDANFKQRSFQLFTDRRARSAVIMVSHSDNTLRRFCDIGGVLHNGQLTVYDSIEEAIEVHRSNQG